uniref:NACHT domain-containing protein n=1 Tax=Varanus komodoensis TaxID=61221 RepID=A0A8D2IFS0_VARKO
RTLALLQVHVQSVSGLESQSTELFSVKYLIKNECFVMQIGSPRFLILCVLSLDYRSHIQRKFQTMKDANSCPGQTVLLKKRYSELIIIDCDWRAKSSTTVEMLFKPDKHGQIPEVVVLLGPAGIGKTMTARKIMLDWASGQLYQDMFDYVFYIHCREMNLCTEERSMVEIILKQWPNEHALKNVAQELLTEIFRNPKKILFLIDGFDELSLFMDLPEGQLWSDPWKKQQVGILLSSLFQKKVLFDCYMIITTRPTALMKIDRFLQYSRYVEILGFSEKDREEYFHKFFQNDDQAKQALRHVKHNGALFTMCSVPLVCWIMCTVLQQQLERGKELGQTWSTLAVVYMLYLKFHQRQRKQEILRIINGMCALAADGIRRQEILFCEDMIRKHGLNKEDSLSLFLNEDIFKEGIECVCAYSFIHLSFQEFLAALHYVREGFLKDVGIMHMLKRSKDVMTLLESYSSSRPDLQVTVCFLFGLINEERMRGLKEMFGWTISFAIKKFLLEWVKILTPTIFQIYLTWERSSLFQFLYETQDENFVKHALQDRTILLVRASSLMEPITTPWQELLVWRLMWAKVLPRVFRSQDMQGGTQVLWTVLRNRHLASKLLNMALPYCAWLEHFSAITKG